MTTHLRAALFVDRDGTIIADAHYPSSASNVRLLHGAADAISCANRVDVPVVVVTNQSGIARGMISMTQYEAVRARTDALLADGDAHVEATYFCPHAPSVSGPCDCRKPGLGMYRQAADQLGLSLERSAYIGDRWRDVQPARDTGGFGVLVPGTDTPEDDLETARTFVSDTIRIASSLREAVQLALAHIRATAASRTEATSHDEAHR